MSASVGRKVLMALSGFFLLIFLLQHCTINLLSVFSAGAFNSASHFMGTNWLIQFVMQPVLAFGVVFHLGMGIMLELKNRSARPVAYVFNNPAANSTWMSRNMIITGMMVLLFLLLHFYDFWIPELNTKYIQGDMSGLVAGSDQFRYWEELHHKFHDPIRVALYCAAFVMLSLHLMHGFQSAFQSVGFRHRKYTPIIKKLGDVYAVIVPAAFVLIAVFHFLTQG